MLNSFLSLYKKHSLGSMRLAKEIQECKDDIPDEVKEKMIKLIRTEHEEGGTLYSTKWMQVAESLGRKGEFFRR